MQQFDLIVIGAGITGVAIASRAIDAGLKVALIEQHATVGQGASFAHNGLLWPNPLNAWLGPGPRRPAITDGLPWRRKARLAAADDAQMAAFSALDALRRLAQEALQEVELRHALEFEARHGGMYLFRSTALLERARALCAQWPEGDSAPKPAFLTAAEAFAAEPALAHTQGLSGALLVSDMMSGNCALAAKRLKGCLPDSPFPGTARKPAHGSVTFFAARRAQSVHPDLVVYDAQGASASQTMVGVDIVPASTASGAFSGVQAKGFVLPTAGAPTSNRDQAERLCARHVVIAGGAGSAPLLGGLGISMPVMYIENRSLTGTVHRSEQAPDTLLIDASAAVSMIRFEQRVRISSALSAGSASSTATTARQSKRTAAASQLLKQADALTPLLHDVAGHHIPGAARLQVAPLAGSHMVGADGLPVIGTLSIPGSASRQISLALAGTHMGWGLAFGAAAVLVDQLQQASGRSDSETTVPGPVQNASQSTPPDNATLAAIAALSPTRFAARSAR